MQVLAVYDDFSKGHYGDNPVRPNGWFGGYNFLSLPNGGVKIRNGTNAMANTGMSNAAAKVAPVSFGLLAKQGRAAWYVPSSGAAPTSISATAFAISNDFQDWTYYSPSLGVSGAVVSVPSDTTYKVTAAAVTALAGAPGGKYVAQLADHLYVANFSGNENRIRWCDTANEGSWTSTNFLDVGMNASEAIIGMKRQRDSLIIITSRAGTTSWYRLSGVPGSTQTLVPIVPRGPSVGTDGSGAVHYATVEGYNSRIWLSPGALDGNYGWVGWIDADTPYVDNKIRATIPTAPAAGIVADYYGIAANTNFPQALFYAQSFGVSTLNQRSVFYNNGVWANLYFNSLTKGGFANDSSIVYGDPGYYYLVQSGQSGTSTKPTFQYWAPDFSIDNAPSPTSDAFSSALDAELHLPLTYDEQNRELVVQAIAVDYRHYSSTTTFTAGVDVHGQRDAVSVSTTPIAVAALGAPATAGQRRRSTIYTGAEAGSGTGFQAKLTACSSIAIERVTVLGTIDKSRT